MSSQINNKYIIIDLITSKGPYVLYSGFLSTRSVNLLLLKAIPISVVYGKITPFFFVLCPYCFLEVLVNPFLFLRKISRSNQSKRAILICLAAIDDLTFQESRESRQFSIVTQNQLTLVQLHWLRVWHVRNVVESISNVSRSYQMETFRRGIEPHARRAAEMWPQLETPVPAPPQGRLLHCACVTQRCRTTARCTAAPASTATYTM